MEDVPGDTGRGRAESGSGAEPGPGLVITSAVPCRGGSF